MSACVRFIVCCLWVLVWIVVLFNVCFELFCVFFVMFAVFGVDLIAVFDCLFIICYFKLVVGLFVMLFTLFSWYLFWCLIVVCGLIVLYSLFDVMVCFIICLGFEI